MARPAEQSDDQKVLRALLAVGSGSRDGGALGDWPAQRVLEIARRQKLAAWIGARPHPDLAPDLTAALARDHAVNLGHHEFLLRRLAVIVERFSADGIACIVFKGLVYDRVLYGATGSRPTGDIDLLVKVEDRRRAMEALVGLGYAPKLSTAPGFDGPDYHEVAFTKENVEIDLHTGLVPPSRCAIDHEAIWRDAEPLSFGDFEVLQISAVHRIVAHALGLAVDHFAVPAIRIVDLDLMMKAGVDLESVQACARQWRCVRPLRTALALREHLLDGTGDDVPTRGAHPARTDAPWPRMICRVANDFGARPLLPRHEQLRRKFEHFDTIGDAIRYTVAFGRRWIGERRARGRSAADRLGIVAR